jgi:hypothetical protein
VVSTQSTTRYWKCFFFFFFFFLWGKRKTKARDIFTDAELDERLALRGGQVRWRGEEDRDVEQ